MLRAETLTRSQKLLSLGILSIVGALAALLVFLGNLGNMGLCGACFLRDTAGSMGFFAKGPAIFRPEVLGLLLGALIWSLARNQFTARSGGYAISRFLLGMWMGIAALVFLGCPFRLLQRLGGGDLHAWAALPGFVLGVLAAVPFEKRGYSIGKTSASPSPVGMLGVLSLAIVFLLYLQGGILVGPGPEEFAGKPAHAAWYFSLGIAILIGAMLSATGFCAVSSIRQILQPNRLMLTAAGMLILGYAAFTLAIGKWNWGTNAQPISHGDWIWNMLSLSLLGFAGALAGGCPVRQMVMAGEGNGDAFLGVVGIAAGAALAHNWGLVSAAATSESLGGPTGAGKLAIAAGLLFCFLYAGFLTRTKSAEAGTSIRL